MSHPCFFLFAISPLKVEIRFKLEDADWLSDELKDGLAKRLANRINAKGEVCVLLFFNILFFH